eukprot:Sspe_Gene.69879::Locus_41239_Transcript_1_1_Confidence_1.000_Length_1243::g.69879::m.69879
MRRSLVGRAVGLPEGSRWGKSDREVANLLKQKHTALIHGPSGRNRFAVAERSPRPDPKQLPRILKHMEERGWEVGRLSFRTALFIAARSEAFGTVRELLQGMEKRGIQHTPKTCAVLLRVMAKKKDARGCQGVLAFMNTNGIAMTTDVHNAALECYQRCGMAGPAAALRSALLSGKAKVPLNTWSWHLILKGSESVEEADRVLRLMPSHVAKHPVVSGVLLGVCARVPGGVGRAEAEVQRMKGKGVALQVEQWTALMSVYRSHELWDKVVGTWDEMLQHRVYPTGIPLCVVLFACADEIKRRRLRGDGPQRTRAVFEEGVLRFKDGEDLRITGSRGPAQAMLVLSEAQGHDKWAQRMRSALWAMGKKLGGEPAPHQ